MELFSSLPKNSLRDLPYPKSTALLVLACGSIVAVATKIVYRIWFHPLSVFPGPKHFAATDLPQDWQDFVQGTFQRDLRALHDKYGPIVRIGPNKLTLDGGVAWPQVFGRRLGKAEFGKVPNWFGPENQISVIMAPRDSHRRQRRHLAHAFSDAALAGQQDLIKKYMDLVLQRFSQHARDSKEVNVVEWLNFLTFDIIGDLAFGDDSFGGLSRSGYHPWVRAIVDSTYGFSIGHFIHSHPLLAPLALILLGNKFFKQLEFISEISVSKAKARISEGEKPGRHDFMTYVTKKNRDGEHGMTYDEQLIVSQLLIVAGSETTATALSGFFFFMGQHPEALQRLQNEVRSAYASDENVDFKNSARLPYMFACLEEILRMYPPVVAVPPRLSPGAEIDGKFVPAGTEVFTSQVATNYNPQHFVEPDSFRPERWLQPTHPLYNAKYANDDLEVMKPFSYGPRDCLGKNLAYAEMRLFVARVTLRFDWELQPGQEKWIDNQTINGTWLKTPLMVKFRERVDGITA